MLDSIGPKSVGSWGNVAGVLWRDHRWALAVVCLSAAALWALDLAIAPGIAGPLNGWWTGVFLVELTPVVILPVLVWHRLVRRASWHEITHGGPATPVRLVGLVLTLLLTRAVVINAVAWKAALPALHPFAFDLTLERLDHALHGRSPWRYLAWLTSPAPLRLMDAFYAAWYASFFVVVVAWGWAKPSPRRRRFVTAMTLTWVVGSLIAILVPSAGPIYYTRVTGLHDHYVELLARLQAVPLAANRLHALLWDTYIHPSPSFAKGIAAFPSLHVAMPALYAISTPPRWRGIRWFWIALTVVTLAGSIVLAWHYAVDGYAGILLAACCWWIAGRLDEWDPMVPLPKIRVFHASAPVSDARP